MKKNFLFLALMFILTSHLNAQTPCNANFTYTINPSGVVTFSGTPTSPSVTYNWTFGNGTSGYGINTSAFYNATGVYTVCLVVQDTSFFSCIDSNCVTITIGSSTPCQANFAIYPDTGGTAPPFQYWTFNSSTGSSLTYTWNWGDGSASSTGSNPTHVYPGPGTYTACLYIDNGVGCTDTFCQTVVVPSASSCQANFTLVPNNSPTSLPYTFDANNTSVGTGLTYTWVWNDGSANSTTANPTHVFPGPGTYNVCLYISNSSGCSDSLCQTITSSVFGCNAYFYIVPDTSVGAPLHTYIGYNASTGSGLSYTWIWGDGSPNGSGAYPSHTYPAAGNYTICLIVMGGGCVDTFCTTQYLNKGMAMVTVNFQAPSSVNSVEKELAELYPNPAGNEIYIKGDPSNLYQIEVFLFNGSRMLSTEAKGNQALDISKLPSGLYMMRIIDAEDKNRFARFNKW